MENMNATTKKNPSILVQSQKSKEEWRNKKKKPARWLRLSSLSYVPPKRMWYIFDFPFPSSSQTYTHVQCEHETNANLYEQKNGTNTRKECRDCSASPSDCTTLHCNPRWLCVPLHLVRFLFLFSANVLLLLSLFFVSVFFLSSLLLHSDVLRVGFILMH